MESFNITDSDHEVRVFVSSTFKDMMKERDYLIKEIFPEIRHRCYQRGIEFTEIDLRWGVTEKQAEQGKVVEVCLKEIDRCRPYFIGILGDRYSWIPPTDEYFKHKRILEEFPWIKDDLKNDLSITEIEIQYGVLRNPTLSMNALFYLSKPQYSLTSSKKAPVTEDDVKLLELKNTIISQKKFSVNKYSTSDELGNLILKDLWEIIEKSFPNLASPEPIEQERLEHTTFLKSRLSVYIGGQKYLNRLNVHADNEDPPLVITGESGLGKSALLANWIVQYQKENPETYILYHFTGGAPDSADYTQIVRRILEELKIKFEINNEIPNSPEEMIKSLPQFLAQTGRHGKWILVIDALDQLENIDKAHLLNWLPEYFPPFVRVIFSTLPNNILEILQKRKYKVINVKPLLVRERKTLIKNYLGKFSKSLPEKATNMIIKARGFENPLLLRTFLDEIRIFGVYEKLEERIDYYIRASNEEDFFNAVLFRMEEDYEKDKKGIVGELLSLIWVSRKGLTERELMEISKVPPLYWSELYNSLENHLIRRNGLMNFFHNYIKEAIEECYLRDEASKKKVHRRLARYFEKNHLSERSLEELPYHLERSKQWKKLKDYLTNIDVFMKIYEKDEYELTQYWRSLDKRFDLGKEYSESVKSYFYKNKTIPETKSKIYDNIGKFLTLNAKYKDAEKMFKHSIKIRKRTFGNNNLSASESLNNLAELYKTHEINLVETERLFKLSLRIRKDILGSTHPYTIRCMNNLIRLYIDQGRYSEAKPLSIKTLKLCERAFGSQHIETTRSLNCLAQVYIYQGLYVDSKNILTRALEIREKMYGEEHPLTASSYTNLARNYELLGHFQKAEPLLKHALKIEKKILGSEHRSPVECMNYLSENLYYQNKFREAEILSQHALTIIDKNHSQKNPISALVLNNLAKIYRVQGKYSKAEKISKRAISIANRILGKKHPLTTLYLENLAHTYYINGKYTEAETIFIKTLSYQEKVFGSKSSYAADSIEHLALIYYIKADYSKSESLFNRILMIRDRIHGSEHPETSANLENLANIARDQDNSSEAELLYKRALKILKMSYGVKHINTASVQNNLAKLYINQKKFEKAESLLIQALKTATNILGSRNLEEASILNNIALLRIKQLRYKEAEGLTKKSLSIRKSKLGEGHIDTAESFVTFANLKEATSKVKQALSYYDKAYKIFEKVLGKRNIHTQNTKRSIEGVLKKIKEKAVIEKNSNVKE
jgi:tetratricopeptide (TPR) repeat protein